MLDRLLSFPFQPHTPAYFRVFLIFLTGPVHLLTLSHTAASQLYLFYFIRNVILPLVNQKNIKLPIQFTFERAHDCPFEANGCWCWETMRCLCSHRRELCNLTVENLDGLANWWLFSFLKRWPLDCGNVDSPGPLAHLAPDDAIHLSRTIMKAIKRDPFDLQSQSRRPHLRLDR